MASEQIPVQQITVAPGPVANGHEELITVQPPPTQVTRNILTSYVARKLIRTRILLLSFGHLPLTLGQFHLSLNKPTLSELRCPKLQHSHQSTYCRATLLHQNCNTTLLKYPLLGHWNATHALRATMSHNRSHTHNLVGHVTHFQP